MLEKGEPGLGKIQFAVDVRVNPLFDLPGCRTGKNNGPEEHQQEDADKGEAGVFSEAKEDFFHFSNSHSQTSPSSESITSLLSVEPMAINFNMDLLLFLYASKSNPANSTRQEKTLTL